MSQKREPIRAIVCDVGGVLIRTQDQSAREGWAARLGVTPAHLDALVFSGESGRQAQLGLKTSAAHWDWLGRHLGLSAVELRTFIDDFFGADQLNVALMDYLQTLRAEGLPLGLLSNYFDEARAFWSARHALFAQVDQAVISAEVKVMKPAPEAYFLILRALGVAPREALFIDDSALNVAGARALGLRGVTFVDTEQAIGEISAAL